MHRQEAKGKTLIFDTVTIGHHDIVFIGNDETYSVAMLVLSLDDTEDMKLYEQINAAVIAHWMQHGAPFPVKIAIE